MISIIMILYHCIFMTKNKLKNNNNNDNDVPFLLQGYELLNLSKNDREELTEGKCPNINIFSIPENVLINHNRFVSLSRYDESKQNIENILLTDYPKISQKDPRWLQLRKGWISASNAATWIGFFEVDLLKYMDLPTSWNDSKKRIDLILEIFEKNIQQEHFMNIQEINNNHNNHTIIGKKEICMGWGRIHERNAIQAVLNLYPHFKIYETGFYPLLEDNFNKIITNNKELRQVYKDFPKIGASPDGIIKDIVTGIHMILECKGPCPFLWNESNKYMNILKTKNHIKIFQSIIFHKLF